MQLTELDPRWVGAGGHGVYQQGPQCTKCFPNEDGLASSSCDVCDGRGYELVPAPERHGVGVSFLCPCAPCAAKRTGSKDTDFYLRVFVGLANPLDGGPAHDPREGAQWTRTGDTFETLTLRPSILRSEERHGCGWHGFVTDGRVDTV